MYYILLAQESSSEKDLYQFIYTGLQSKNLIFMLIKSLISLRVVQYRHPINWINFSATSFAVLSIYLRLISYWVNYVALLKIE